MGDDVNVGNIIVAFGGVFLLGVIGFLVAWFAVPDDDREPAARTTPPTQPIRRAGVNLDAQSRHR